MHLSVSQKKLNEEIGDEYRREQLTAKIRDTENLISESEKKIAAKEISMYVHCRQEEKGTSRDTSNYVYRIKQEKRHLADYRAELEKVKRELDEIVD